MAKDSKRRKVYRTFVDCADIEHGKKITLDSPEPEGYIQWHYWAGLQMRAKRKQARCRRCWRLFWVHLGCGRCGGEAE